MARRTDQRAHCEDCKLEQESTACSLDPQELATQLSRPTRWWHCSRCDAHLERYRGTGDTSCACGAQYNAFGQRLRDDWAENPSNTDDDISDLEGFEIAQLRNEGPRLT